MDGRYMVGLPYGIPALPGPNINGGRLAVPPQPPHPGGQTGVITFPRTLQPQQSVARPFIPPVPQPQPAPQPQRIPQVDGPSESSDDEGSSPPPSQGQSFAPRASHPSLPQPAASSSTISAPQADSEAINSDLDDSDTEGEEDAEEGTAGETDIVFCTYDKVGVLLRCWSIFFIRLFCRWHV